MSRDSALADAFVRSGCGTVWPLRLVVHQRARRLRLACDPVKGEFRLTVPPRLSRRKAIAWADQHRAWAEEQAGKGGPKPIGDGSVVPFRGGDCRIDWSDRYGRMPMMVDGTLRVGGPIEAVGRRLERWLREQARDILTEETHEYAASDGLACASVSIGDPRSRWGSCSARGTIRYNWRLVLAPDFVRRATVSHEVAHLAHLDHSARFHAMHADLFEGDPVAARAWLREHGQAIRTLRFS